MQPIRDALGRHDRLVAALLRPGALAANGELIRTHISSVLLAGDFAYKLKKPVNLGFLDFSTLSARRRACAAEVRLNRRLAPEIYLDVVPIGGSLDHPEPFARPVLDYAVRMRRFPSGQLLSDLAAAGTLTTKLVDELAHRIAGFHARAKPAPATLGFGPAHSAMAPVRANFATIRREVSDTGSLQRLDALAARCEARYRHLIPHFTARHRRGFVRECHGDLHLGNITLVDCVPVAFDCIEFSLELRFIDVTSEIAFLVMDLEHRGLSALAVRFLNTYLEITGDYAGLRALPFYVCYRAMVRAKVALIRAGQDGSGTTDCKAYLALAERALQPRRSAIVITHGPSGAGKSVHALAFAESIGAIRLRADVERKRIAGLSALARTASAPGAGLYGPAMTRRTFARLARLAESIVRAGLPVIVDATFLARGHRERFRGLARSLGLPFLVLQFDAPVRELLQRVAARDAEGRDASEATVAVLENQLTSRRPLDPDERDAVVRVPPDLPLASPKSLVYWRRVCRRLGVGFGLFAAEKKR